jgi:large conductance mechanosensitive channel
MWGEFKKFIMRGNVMDLAIAVVLATAFGAIVNGLVNDIIMPVIGALTAGLDFSSLKIILIQASADGKIPATAITYGHLIQVIIQLLIVALTIFFLVKGLNRLRKKSEKPEEPAAKPDDILLLEEIRDLLKK